MNTPMAEFAAVHFLLALNDRSGSVSTQSPLVHFMSFLRRE